MIAANEVGHDKAFERQDNELLVLWKGGRRELGRGLKSSLARDLIALIAETYRRRCSEAGAADTSSAQRLSR